MCWVPASYTTALMQLINNAPLSIRGETLRLYKILLISESAPSLTIHLSPRKGWWSRLDGTYCREGQRKPGRAAAYQKPRVERLSTVPSWGTKVPSPNWKSSAPGPTQTLRFIFVQAQLQVHTYWLMSSTAVDFKVNLSQCHRRAGFKL